MPQNQSRTVLFWSPEQECYLIQVQEGQVYRLDHHENATLSTHLHEYEALSFRGKEGNLTLKKEKRQRGGAYWYAYRRQNKLLRKKYLGSESALTLSQLEAIARILNTLSISNASPNHKGVLKSSSEENTNRIALPAHSSPKLNIPPPRPTLIPRPSLLALLEKESRRRVTLVSAPAGAGKTSLLTLWAQQPRQANVSWLSLDQEDNDPNSFWYYLITACKKLYPEIRIQTKANLSPSSGLGPQPSLHELIRQLLQEIERFSDPGFLVLEDYHLLAEKQIHAQCIYFIDHLPSHLHLIILTRHDPPFPLAKWRGHDELSEIRSLDLFFSQTEIQTFLTEATSVPLSDATLTQVSSHTEGWPVGIQLLALNLQRHFHEQDREEIARSFRGSHRTVFDYFLEEVLHHLPQKTQEFFLQTSILHRFTPDLCDTVTQQSDSHLLLMKCECDNLFLTSLDNLQQWYRYHDLFADALSQEARRRFTPSTLQTLHLRASRWFADHSFFNEAIEHALNAKDFLYVAQMIKHNISPTALSEKIGYPTIYRWLQQVPPETLYQYPELCISYALAILFTQDRYAHSTKMRMEEPLAMAEKLLMEAGEQGKLGHIYMLRALVAWWQKEREEAFSFAHRALAHLPAEDQEARAICLMKVGLQFFDQGSILKAQEHIRATYTISKQLGNIFLHLVAATHLGQIALHLGQLHQAEWLFKQVDLEIQAKWGGLEKSQKVIDDRVEGLYGLAIIHYEWNDLEKSMHLLNDIVSLSKSIQRPQIFIAAHALLACIQQAQGQDLLADQTIQTMYTQTTTLHLHYDADLAAAKCMLLRGDTTQAQRYLQTLSSQEPFFPAALYREQIALLTIRLFIAQEKYTEAIPLLRYWQDEALRLERRRMHIELLLLCALVHRALHDLSAAKKTLIEALTMAMAEGYQRLFINEKETLKALFRLVYPDLQQSPLRTYVQHLLLAMTTTAGKQARYGLTQQEQRVLRLLATGQTQKEIAQHLVVSANTIKSQIQSIYRKLNVSSRQDACELAHRLQLL